METLLTLCQLFFLILGIWGVIASSISSYMSMRVAAIIYFMSAFISYYHGSWIPLVLGFLALLGMRYFGFEPSGKDVREDALKQLSLDSPITSVPLFKDGASSPLKKPPTQKEFWDKARKDGVDINAVIRSMPTLPPSDRLRVEKEIVASIVFYSVVGGSSIFYDVYLPLSKNNFFILFRDYHQYHEYVNLVDLIREVIHPDFWTSNFSPDEGVLYRVFDQDKQYLFSWSHEKMVHFEVRPEPA